jgi:glutathione S-transferase
MITLITFPPAFGEASASPFCLKAIAMLNMAGVDWQREDTNDPRKMPYQKLPTIRVAGQLIGDSTLIRRYLEEQGANFDKDLSGVQKAQSRALIHMAEDHLYFHQLLDRWGNDEVWAILRETFFVDIPKPLRGLINGRIRAAQIKGVKAQGLGRFTEAERLDLIEPDLEAIATLVGDGFLFGDKATAADISVAAILSGMMATPVPTDLQQRVAHDPVLKAYVGRVSPLWATG